MRYKMSKNKTKDDESKEIDERVNKFVEGGGEIVQVSSGLTGSGFRFNVTPNPRPGFHREKILLNEKN